MINSNHNICRILLNLYIHILFFLGFDKAGILNKPGNKYIKKGYNNDKKKLIIVSFNK